MYYMYIQYIYKSKWKVVESGRFKVLFSSTLRRLLRASAPVLPSPSHNKESHDDVMV